MKKILALLLTILLLTIAFVSCNLDGTSGIFRDIAQSTAPLSIRYEQLLGIKGTDLYFRTAEGVERVSKLTYSRTPVVSSKYENIIQAAALSSSGSEVFYITNNEDELAANQIRVVDTNNLNAIPGKIPIITSITLDPLIRLYANSMILVTGKDAEDNKVFQLLKYDGTDFETPVVQSTLTETGYGLESVIQQTAKEQDATAPMIVSFVKNINSVTSVYKHYLIDPTATLPATPKALLGFDDVQIANFINDSGNIYVLTTDGILYYAGTLTTPAFKVEMITSDKTYLANAFVYGYVDADGVNYHLITKPSTTIIYNFPLEVFTFAKGTNTISSTAKITTGYAKDISQFPIISAFQKSATNLLVATDRNGIFEITITDPTTGSGDSIGPEDYTF